MKKILTTLIIICIFFCNGCTQQVMEPFKTVWGSSTRALDHARDEAISKIYSCSFDICYDAVLNIVKKAEYVIFINDRVKKHIVVMGIKGNVNTTEVGIFFDTMEAFKTKIDISSLSSSAKEKVAQVIFDGLDKKFKKDTVEETKNGDKN